MIQTFSSFVFVAIFAQISIAKDLGNIFTEVNYIKSASPKEVNAGTPFSHYKANLSFNLDVSKSGAAVRDTFRLTLPDVYEARTHRDDPKQCFHLAGKQGPAFASCWIDSPKGEYPSTNVSCVLVQGISVYEVVSGELVLFLLFDGGGRRDALALAQKWKVGSNQVTFNNAISGELQLSSQNISGHSTVLAIATDTELLLTYLSSESICPDGIRRGEFFCTLSNQYDYYLTRIETFIATSVNEFGQPTAAADLLNGVRGNPIRLNTFSISFGSIPQGQRFFFVSSVVGSSRVLNVQYFFSVECLSGARVVNQGSMPFNNGRYGKNIDSVTDYVNAVTTFFRG